MTNIENGDSGLLKRFLESKTVRTAPKRAALIGLLAVVLQMINYGLETDWSFITSFQSFNLVEVLQLNFNSIDKSLLQLLSKFSLMVPLSAGAGIVTAYAISVASFTLNQTNAFNFIYTFINNAIIESSIFKDALAKQTAALNQMRLDLKSVPDAVAKSLASGVTIVDPVHAKIIADVLTSGLPAQVHQLRIRVAELEEALKPLTASQANKVELEQAKATINQLQGMLLDKDKIINQQRNVLIKVGAAISSVKALEEEARQMNVEITASNTR